MVQLVNTVSTASRHDASSRSSPHLQRATQFLTRVKEIFPDDGSKAESFSHFGQLMLPFHGAIMRELSWIEKASRSPELVPSSGEIPPWVTSGVKREEYEAIASLLSRDGLLDALPQYLEDVKKTMIAMRKFELKMISESRQLFNRSQFILCRYRYGQQGLLDTHSQLKGLFRDRLDILNVVEEILGIPSEGESEQHSSYPSTPSSSSSPPPSTDEDDFLDSPIHLTSS
jgi:hypothetical protein